MVLEFLMLRTAIGILTVIVAACGGSGQPAAAPSDDDAEAAARTAVVRIGSVDEAVKYVEALAAPLKQAGGTAKVDNRQYDCHAADDLAYCLATYDFIASMPDGMKVVQPSRTTIVLRQVDGSWKWVHWHTSLSEQPK
jgi:ketosteroid isomerase-like protein